MDNEKYGIELELVLDKFNSQAQKVKNTAKEIQSAFDPNKLGRVKINGQEWIRGFRTTASNLKGQAQQLADVYERQGHAVEQVEMQTEKAARRVVSLNDGFSKTGYFVEPTFLKVADATEKVAENTERASAKARIFNVELKNMGSLGIGKSLDKMTSKIKRFGLSLLSIRSIWALVSRASSAYLAQNTELSNRLQSVWAGLGALLSPIIEGIVNTLAKAVKYIAIFIKALTGVDLLARATAKSMNGTTKAAKGLNKALAGFDELQNLDTDASGGTAGALGGIADLNNIKVDTKWADRLERFGNYVRTNWPTVLSLLFGVVTFFNVVGPLMTAFGVKVGMLKALGIGIAIAGIVYTISSLIQYLQNPTWENFGKIIKGIGITVIGLGIAFLSLPAIITGVVILIVGVIVKHWEQVQQLFQNGIDWLTGLQDRFVKWFMENLDTIQLKFGYLGTGVVGIVIGVFNWIVEIVKGAIDIVLNVFTGLFTGVRQIFDGILMIFKGQFKNGFISIAKGIGNIFIGIINGVISGINAIIYPIRLLVTQAGKIAGKNWSMSNVAIPKISYLDVGTNYVPEDQLAMIHKGEAVVPKKFNSREYFGGTNDETNSLLQELISRVENIELNPYITVKDIGKASLSYINGKSRQLGESVVR